jgi:hypothetical protein
MALLDPASSYLSIDYLSTHLIPSILGSNLELKYPVFLFISRYLLVFS